MVLLLTKILSALDSRFCRGMAGTVGDTTAVAGMGGCCGGGWCGGTVGAGPMG